MRLVTRSRSLPYDWPGPSDAAAALRDGRGTCASMHALMAQRPAGIDVEATPLLMVGRLVPASLRNRFPEAAGLLEVHESLTLLTPWAGPIVVDITWDPSLVAKGYLVY